MIGPSDENRKATGWPAWAWLVVVALVVVARLPLLATAGVGRATAAIDPLRHGLVDSVEQRIAKASGITAAFVAAVRRELPADGRLVLYGPYSGELEFMLRLQFERTKNLLYPFPRDVHFARNAAELQQKVPANSASGMLVVDGTQEPIAMTIGGDYELVHEERLANVWRIRLWRLVRPR